MCMELTEECRKALLERGASLVGFADLNGMDSQIRSGFHTGIAIAVALNRGVIRGIMNGPTHEYYDAYKSINILLDGLDSFAAEWLQARGYTAMPRIRSSVEEDERTWRTALPHKTVATRAGIGWIGKCALLVTEPYGSAVRISAVLTDAPLKTAEPIVRSRCGECTVCKTVCPAKAVSGLNWNIERDRDEFFNPFSCRRTARKLAGRIGIGETICGKCIAHCPWTQRYLSSEEETANVHDHS